MQWIEGIRRRVPFGVINRSVARVVTRVLRHFSHDAALAFEKLHFGVAVVFVAVVGVMRADEVCGHVVSFTEVDELFYPLAPLLPRPPTLNDEETFLIASAVWRYSLKYSR